MKITRPACFGLLLFATAFSLTAQTNVFPSSGNVGIGTTSPTHSLEVTGGIKAAQAGFGRDAFSAWPLITQGFAAGFIEASGQHAITILPDYSGFNYIISDYFSGTSHLPLVLSGRGTIPDLVLDTTGSVGIGTTSPYSAPNFGTLDVRGPTGGDISLGSNSLRTGIFYSYAAQTVLGSVNAAPLVFTTTDTERMRIDGSGNVGIGTTNPTQKLSVNGTIRAKEVIVDTGWSDFVFQADYRLAPLSEVEGAIQKDGHLPGIPSAQEVAEHGVSMGEMQSKLLAKIEELTLHMIDQQKQQLAQEKRLQSLEIENKILLQKIILVSP